MKLQWLKTIFTGLILWSFLLTSIPVKAQGSIVTSEDISGGSSVFVFRKSSKAPQAKFAPKNKPKRNNVERAETRKSVKEQAKKVIPARTKVVAKVVTKPTPKPTPVNGKKTTPTPIPIKTVTPEDASNSMGAGAEILLDRGDFDKSIAMFRESIKLYPANTLAQGGLSEALATKADWVFENRGADLSIPIYEEALKYNPNNAEALAGIGGAYESMDNDQKAFEYYEKAIAINQDLTELFAPLGIGYYQRGEIEKADFLLTKAVASRNNDYQTQYLLGLIRYKQNRLNQAVEAFKNASNLNKDFAEAHYYLGEVYDSLNQDNDSFAEYNKAVQINPKYAEAWFDLGVAYFNRDRYPEAINAYSKAIQFNNANYEAHANLADIYRIQGFNIVAKNKTDELEKRDLYGKAEGSYRTATDLAEINPKAKEDRTAMSELYSKYGFVLGRLLKWNSAINALNKAISYNPDSNDYSNVGWAYYNAAQTDLRIAGEKNTPEQQKLESQAKAKTNLELGQTALQKAVAMDSNSKAAYMNLGVTQSDLGDYKGAIESLKKCLSLSDDWFVAYNELGLAYRGAGNLSEAANNFRKASDFAEKSLSKVKSDIERNITTQQLSSGLYNLAITEKDRGNDKEARKAQDRLRKYNPNMANILEAMFLSSVKNKVENKIQQKNPLKKFGIPY